jgi:hypothetical protein
MSADSRLRATIFLDNDCKVVNDPNREEPLALKARRERPRQNPTAG